MRPLSSRFSAIPPAQGLYRPEDEKDACGLALVATLRGSAGHDIVRHGLTALENLDHRGAVGAEENTGDGAGIMLQMPDAFLRAVLDVDLPQLGAYAAGCAFLSRDEGERALQLERIDALAAEEGLSVLATREVPVVDGLVGPTAEAVRPHMVQIVLVDAAGTRTDLDLERAAFVLRRRVEHTTDAYFPSLSTRVLVYKGMLTTAQLGAFYPDLSDERMTTRLAIVHSRFSTNTFPSWPLAHPFRTLAHNGEINTVIGNRNRLQAAEGRMRTDVFGEDFSRILPVNTPGASDSASLDEALELLTLAGRTIPHALMMLVPRPWENDPDMDPDLRAFYEYHAALQEPWDGPAALLATDGTVVAAGLDRNGLRPMRWCRSEDGLVVLGSESGMIEMDAVAEKGRVEPGGLFVLDVEAGRIIPREEAEGEVVSLHPWRKWLDEQKLRLEDLPEREHVRHSRASVVRRQQASRSASPATFWR